MTYTVRYVDKVLPRPTDVGPAVVLTKEDVADRKALAAALRKQNALAAGASVTEFRIEPDGRIVVFPRVPGMTTYWHSVILTPQASPPAG